MKIWDPLSIFKYLTGSPTIHLTMFLILACTAHKFEIEAETRTLYTYNFPVGDGKKLKEEKINLIYM